VNIKIASVLFLAALFSILGACSSDEEKETADRKTEAAASDSGLVLLASYMTGSFSSEKQAAADSHFYDIRLEMVPIWPERRDGPWLYVEQAAASGLDKPYRQRVYRLSARGDGLYRSDVYTITEPLRLAGAWRVENPLSDLAPDSLELRRGCSITLRRRDDTSFAGATTGTGCESELAGAAYATSTVMVAPSLLFSWDRGFDADNNQVWGAETGGYRFDKIKDYEITW